MIPQNTLVPLQFGGAIEQAVRQAIAYVPTLIGALIILVVGYIVGRVLGGIVTRVLRKIGIGDYTEGTAMEEVGKGDGIARALGTVVAYYVYFVAILAAADVLDIPQLTELLSEIGVFLPVVLAALVVLVIGFVAGRIIGDIVADVVGGFGIGRYLRETPLERFGDTEGEFGRIVGTIVTYYVYLLTLLAVADILAIGALSSLLNEFAAYLPALAGGFLVLVVGIWVAERLAALVRGSDDSRTAHLASLGVKVLIYYITVTIALGAVGFTITPLTTLFTTFVVAFFGALAIALAIGVGVAVGLGGQDYVAENIDDWTASISRTVGDDTDASEE